VAIYEIGDRVRLFGDFANDAGVPTNPTTTTLKVVRPRTKIPVVIVFGVDDKLVNDAPGHFYYDWIVDAVGTHTYELIGTGLVQRTVAGTFQGVATIP
jgi:hypothetical protein